MLNKTHLSAAMLFMLFSAGCLDPDVNTVRPEHQDARVPSNLCENVVCPLSDDPCTQDGVCDPGTGECVISIRRDGDFCDDGNFCTDGERCLGGACTGGSPVLCQPISQCHEAGSCDPESGCSSPLKPAGTSCGDGNSCTLDDQCDDVGDCVGTPKVCEAIDGCHEAGVCNSATGQCTNPNSPDGKSCDGPDTDDLCLTGTCLDAACVLVEKSCPNTPCKTGQCISETGECGFDSNVQLPAGTPCATDALCASETDLSVDTVCDENGACGAGVSVSCETVLARTACDIANPCETGERCEYQLNSCSENTACESGESCEQGVCVSNCSDDNPCLSGASCIEGACVDDCSDDNPCGAGFICTERGACVLECGVDEMCADGLVCSDDGECLAQGLCTDACSVENPCPTGEACFDGICNDDCSDSNPCPVGEYCSDSNECVNDCLVREACDDETGCYTSFKPDGTECLDQNPCTYNTRCQAGRCSGDVISCSPADQGTCQTDGQCNVLTGECEYNIKEAGASCNTNLCEVNQICNHLGECLAGQPRSCRAPDQCQVFSGCDPLVGCEYTPKPEGNVCYPDGQGPTCDPEAESPCEVPNANCVRAEGEGDTAVYRCALGCSTLQICALEVNEGEADSYRCKAPCSDGQACTIRDACDVFRVGAGLSERCVGEQKQCNTPPDAQCYVPDSGLCDAISGECEYETVTNGEVCSDGSSCTGEVVADGSFVGTDRCIDGACVSGIDKTCNEILCQAVSCDGTIANQDSNCVSQPDQGAACRQAEFCVAQATCNAEGECADVVYNNCPLPEETFPEDCFESLGQCQEVARACYYTTSATSCSDNDPRAICALQADSVSFGAGTVRPGGVSAQEQAPIAFVDLDADGRMDVLMGGLSGLTFYHNQTPSGALGPVALAEGTDFALEINTLFAEEIRNVKALLVGDMDNDDAPDLIVLSYPNTTSSRMRYFKGTPRPNEVGGGTSGFTFVAQPTYFPENIQTESPSSGVLADFDNDGDLDLFVGSYSGVDNLYLNALDAESPAFELGDTRIPDFASLKTTSIALADFGGDRFPDLAICNESNETITSLLLLEHAGAGALASGDLLTAAQVPSLGNGVRSYCKGVSSVDYDADSDVDLFVSRFEKNQLLRFDPNASSYSPVQNGQGLEKSNRPHFQFCSEFADRGDFKLDKIVSWASAWGDWNSDGFLDAYIARGAAEEPAGIAVEARYLMDGFYLVDPSQGFLFEDGIAKGLVAGDSRSSRSAAIADLNNDGDLDLIVNHQTDRPKIVQNNTEQLNSFRFTIEGRTVNRDAVGSKVITSFDSGAGLRSQSILIGGNQTGVSGATEINHIGVGAAATVDVEVLWQLPLGETVTQKIYDVATQSPAAPLSTPMVIKEPGNEIVDLQVEWGPDRFDDVPFSAGNADELLANGDPCQADAECESTACDTSLDDPVCVALPTCDDAELNGSETSQDCGGPDCSPCVDGRTCSIGADCESQICSGDPEATCQVPTCSDAATNGDETDIDCGGSCPNACATGAACQEADDCVEGVCTNNVCVDAECDDGVQNGNETDVNCGGDCPGCRTGQTCVTSTDCRHLNCVNDICAAPTCFDRIKNGDERAVDCGGPDCATTCDDGTSCNVASDCTSGVCGGTPLTCQEPTCSDAATNGDETDIDCGGSCPDKCDAGEDCSVDSDCNSNKCYEDLCRRQNSRSVNVQFTVKRFENHSGLEVECSVRLNDEAANVVPIGMASYTNGVHVADITTNVIVNDPDATSANITVECALKSSGTIVDGTQTQAKASLNN